jgi:hypothetical protein
LFLPVFYGEAAELIAHYGKAFLKVRARRDELAKA